MKRTIIILGLLATLLVGVAGPTITPAVASDGTFDRILPFPDQWRPGN